MKKTIAAALTSLFLTTLSGCQTAPAPQPAAPRADAVAPTATALLPVTSPAEAGEPALVPILDRGFGEGAAAPDTCGAAASARGYYGFYAKDAWTRGDVVLTFDDGPHPTATPRVLDMLTERKMHATFFLVGRNISRHTYPLVQRMIAGGHTLGSHSYSHDVRMTNVATPKETVETIRSQHEVTTILIDIALLAKSGDDFDAMFRTVFESDPAKWLTETGIRKSWRGAAERHEALLVTRGFEAGARPYTVLYSRPPGGGPYVEHDGAAGMALYDEALTQLGMMNVMWHGASGDTVPGKRSDFGFLTKNMEKYARSGGVLLIHDYIRPDALAESLETIDLDPSISVMSMDEAVKRKYGCAHDTLGTEIGKAATDGVLFRGLFDAPTPVKAAAPAVALVP